MGIFEIRTGGEKVWVAANTNIHALKIHEFMSEMNLCEFENEDEIIEVPENKWSKMFVTDEYGKQLYSFKDWMKKNTKPDIIAMTVR